MSWLTPIFDRNERVRRTAEIAYRQNRERVSSDRHRPELFNSLMAMGMQTHEVALALTLGAFYERSRRHPATDRAVLCEVTPFFFIFPEQEAVTLLAEYCSYLTNAQRANVELLSERLSDAVIDSQCVPCTAAIHAQYREWAASGIAAGCPWLVLLKPGTVAWVDDYRAGRLPESDAETGRKG